MRFGEKIRILRTQRGLSQEQLALELGVSRQAISRWELGEVVPDTANVLRLSQLFGVSTDYLLHENYAGDRDIPAVKTVEFDLQKRQRAVGTGMFCRFGMLAAPALYHSEVRRGRRDGNAAFFMCACLGVWNYPGVSYGKNETQQQSALWKAAAYGCRGG